MITKEYCESVIIPTYMKGDRFSGENRRWVSFISIAFKLFRRAPSTREGSICEDRACHFAGWGCIGQTLALQQMI